MYNILYIENGKGFGGATTSLAYLIWNLDKKKFKPYVFSSYQTNFWHTGANKLEVRGIYLRYITDFEIVMRLIPLVKKYCGDFIKKIVASCFVFLDFVFCIIPYTLKLFFLVKGRNIKLIHLNNTIYKNAYGIFLSKLLKVPCVCHHREFQQPYPHIKWLAKLADYHIAISPAIKKNLLEIGIKASKIGIAYEGVDLNEYSWRRNSLYLRKQFGINNSSLNFGIVGCLSVRKGQHIFLQAAKKVFKVIPQSRAIIIGDTPDGTPGYREHLEKLTHSLGIAEKVTFTGYRRNVADFLQILDVVVHAAIAPEPFGRVIIEAMAMKKSVVATNTGAPSEIIHNHQNGLLVQPGNSEALADTIIELLEDEHKREMMGEEARKIVEEKYSIEHHVNVIERVYTELLR